MKVKLKGSFEDKGKVHRKFNIESERGMTLEIEGVCKIECSCMKNIVATRINIWGNMSIEIGANCINAEHVTIKRV